MLATTEPDSVRATATTCGRWAHHKKQKTDVEEPLYAGSSTSAYYSTSLLEFRLLFNKSSEQGEAGVQLYAASITTVILSSEFRGTRVGRFMPPRHLPTGWPAQKRPRAARRLPGIAIRPCSCIGNSRSARGCGRCNHPSVRPLTGTPVAANLACGDGRKIILRLSVLHPPQQPGFPTPDAGDKSSTAVLSPRESVNNTRSSPTEEPSPFVVSRQGLPSCGPQSGSSSPQSNPRSGGTSGKSLIA